MSNLTTIPLKLGPEGKKHANQKYYNVSFAGRDLQHADFRSATVCECDFTGADLSHANFKGANCWGSNFTDSRMYRTDMTDANLSKTIMKPKDCFGISLTFTCDTVMDMQVSEKWYHMWLFMAGLMKPPSDEDRLKLIHAIGEARYIRLRQLFESRQI